MNEWPEKRTARFAASLLFLLHCYFLHSANTTLQVLGVPPERPA